MVKIIFVFFIFLSSFSYANDDKLYRADSRVDWQVSLRSIELGGKSRGFIMHRRVVGMLQDHR